MSTKKFLEQEYELASQHEVKLNFDLPTRELVRHYLRAWRGRSDLSESILNQGESEIFLSHLNKIRELLRNDELSDALALIESTTYSCELERIELELERCRYYLFSKKYNSVIEISTRLLANDSTPAQTRMTLLQVSGIAKIYSGQALSAIADLEAAIELSHILPTAPSAFGSYTVMSQAYSCLGQQAEAIRFLKMAESILDQVNENEIWIERLVNLMRSRVRYACYFDSRENYIKTTQLTKLIANWLGAKVISRLCDEDLDSTPYTILGYSFLGGLYVPELKIALLNHPKKVVRFTEAPQTSQILEILCKGDMTKSELFEKVWGFRYDESLHDVHLRNMLSKLRKKLPEGVLTCENKIVSLKK